VLGTGPIGIIVGSVIRRLLAPSHVASVDTSPARNRHAEEHFSQRAYLPDELCELDDSTFDYVFDTLPTVTGMPTNATRAAWRCASLSRVANTCCTARRRRCRSSTHG